MTYVLYHVKSTVAVKHYATLSAARRGKTCSNRNAKMNVPHGYDPLTYAPYDICDLDTYNTKVVTMRTVKSLMSGKEVVIPSNTPLHLDPSSETYWSS